jgi:exodeoxyribonuclease V beta subunit
MSGAPRHPRPAELAGLGHGPRVVEASAGTGKTYLLEHLFVDLILRGAAAEEILVVTFTEKATAELQTRVRALLEKLLDLPPDAGADLPVAEAFVLDRPAQERLRRARRAFDAVTIATMHGFCQRVLTENAFAQGRPWREEVLDGAASFQAIFRAVVRESLAQDGPRRDLLATWLDHGRTVDDLGDFLAKLHRQKDAERRPAWNPERVIAALADLRVLLGRRDELLALLTTLKINGGTRNALLRRIDKLTEVATDHHGPLAIFQMDPEWFTYLLDKWPKTDHPLLTDGEARLAALAATLVPLEVAMAAEFLDLVADRLARHRRARGELDFDDLIANVAAALAAGTPEAEGLRLALRRRYRHALIDEFQDTDHLQWSIFRRLFSECGPGRSLTVIGDPKQAIYGFRGADVYTYLEARDAIEAQTGPSLRLARNYRSTPALVAACNRVFDQAAPFFRPGSGITYDHPVRAAQAGLGLRDAKGGPAAPLVLLRPDLADEDKVRLPRLRADLRVAMVRAIAELLAPTPGLRRVGKEGPIVPSDIFVLSYRNEDSQEMGRDLAAAGIPYAFYKQDNLFSTVEADALLHLLRALARPGDRSLRARALLTPFFDLPLAEVANPDDHPALRLFFALAAEARAGHLPTLLGRCLEETGLLRRLLFVGDERGLTNYLHLRELLQAEWARGGQTLGELLEGFASRRRGSGAGNDTYMQRLSTDKASVQLLTVHKAKGLEADFVFLYGGLALKDKKRAFLTYHEGHQPVVHLDPRDEGAIAKARREREDEDHRLLYVALTRARYRLYLPFLPPAVKPMLGRLRALNQRLDALADDPELLEVRPASRDDGLPTFSPAPAPVPAAPDPVPATPSLRPGQRGFLVTSYSAIKRAAGGFAPVEEPAPPSPGLEIPHAEAPDADDLPGGPDTGVFLHSLLEVMPMAKLRDLAGPLEADPELLALGERERRRAGRPPAHLVPALRLVERAYRTPVRLGERRLPGLAFATRHLREMEFLFPIPEAHHALLGRPGGAGFAIERGLVKGFIDLLFEAGGRVYVCDWKSDVLPRYDGALVTQHCENNYDLQARLYTLATVRWLGLRDEAAYQKRMGGILYCFVRGLDPADDRRGVYFRRPAWAEILAWEADLLAHDFGGP